MFTATLVKFVGCIWAVPAILTNFITFICKLAAMINVRNIEIDIFVFQKVIFQVLMIVIRWKQYHHNVTS